MGRFPVPLPADRGRGASRCDRSSAASAGRDHLPPGAGDLAQPRFVALGRRLGSRSSAGRQLAHSCPRECAARVRDAGQSAQGQSYRKRHGGHPAIPAVAGLLRGRALCLSDRALVAHRARHAGSRLESGSALAHPLSPDSGRSRRSGAARRRFRVGGSAAQSEPGCGLDPGPAHDLGRLHVRMDEGLRRSSGPRRGLLEG